MIECNSSAGVRLTAGLMPLLVAGLGLGLAASSGCESRNLGWVGTEYGCWDLWECNPDRDCGEMVQCVDGQCRPDVGPVLVECPYGDCIVDNDCVVAAPYDCCNGCPQVARRAELGELPCFFEAGTPPGPAPPQCAIDCTSCPICFPQPLGVRCDLGRCVPTAEGCNDATGTETITTAALLTNPQSYDGQTFRIQGTVLPASAVCNDDCPDFHCCEHSPTLDGVVRLQGSPCDMWLAFWGDDSCADDLDTEGMLPGGEYAVTGLLLWTPSEPIPWTMDVLTVTVESQRALGGAYEVFVTAVESDADDPSCLPPTLSEGDWGRVFVAEEGGLTRIAAPLFECHWEFVGTADPEGWVNAQAPALCDGVCDYIITGQITGEMIFAAYTTLDGLCYHEYQFSGQRLDNEHDYPTN